MGLCISHDLNICGIKNPYIVENVIGGYKSPFWCLGRKIGMETYVMFILNVKVITDKIYKNCSQAAIN